MDSDGQSRDRCPTSPPISELVLVGVCGNKCRLTVVALLALGAVTAHMTVAAARVALLTTLLAAITASVASSVATATTSAVAAATATAEATAVAALGAVASYMPDLTALIALLPRATAAAEAAAAASASTSTLWALAGEMAGAATAVACLEFVSRVRLKIGPSAVWSYLFFGWLGALTGEMTSLAAVVACLRRRVSILWRRVL